jgi:hypothetical protein
MGFGLPPYNSIKTSLVVEDVIYRNRHNNSNPFAWDFIQLNLPWTIGYDPSVSWIQKIRKDQLAVCNLFIFVDYECIKGATCELTWLASHWLVEIQAYLGIQMHMKVGPCVQQPRAWKGAVMRSVSDQGIFVLMSEEKWVTKAFITKCV